MLQLESPIAPADDLAAACAALRREMRDLQVESVQSVESARPPVGAKAGELYSAAGLAVALTPAVIPAVVEFVKAWLQRQSAPQVSVTMKMGDREVALSVNGAPDQRAVDALVAHASRLMQS
jgi:hypothetical protein